jgi:aspartyl-tRNA(Asn)/glutamyl-tRNA(Gln) amidotransferase subunit A
MPLPFSPLRSLHDRYLRKETTPSAELDAALANANHNIGHNVYLAQDAAWSHQQAAALQEENISSQLLWGVPVSIKDCFDLAGFPTSCGSSFYREHNGIATQDSTVASRLKAAGAVITGKTHLHQLAYGITGENRDFGDCAQPRNAAWLTGGSSSGAVASVQEGSALAAIGTDTGGSIRVPAALCGLAGYRSSITLNTPELWQGGAHLAASFDTIGWLHRDLRDGPLLASALLGLRLVEAPSLSSLRIGIPQSTFFHDCEPAILGTLNAWKSVFAAEGSALGTFDATPWEEARNIFAPIQAHEAAALHKGHYHQFEPAIAERLAWGASISSEELSTLQAKLSGFRKEIAHLFEDFDYLLLPCSPMEDLLTGADHSQTRVRILRYTTPISLAGLPVVTLPGEHGGLQLVGRLDSDAELLAISALLAAEGTTIAPSGD